MKLKSLKFVFTFICLSFFILLTGCSTTTSPDQYSKISPQEQQNLITFARNVIIDMPGNRITKEEKEIITSTTPKFSVNYTGNERGHYNIIWNINLKTINYVGDGDLTDPQASYTKINIIEVSTE